MVKFKQKWLIWIIFGVFLLNFIPGTGFKMPGSQQAIVASEFTCSQDSDCPTCVGAQFVDEDPATFPGELGVSYCSAGKCQLSEYCIVWDCGDTQQNCDSIRQTILDNTFLRFQQNPTMFILLILGVVAWVML